MFTLKVSVWGKKKKKKLYSVIFKNVNIYITLHFLGKFLTFKLQINHVIFNGNYMYTIKCIMSSTYLDGQILIKGEKGFLERKDPGTCHRTQANNPQILQMTVFF